MPQSPRDKAIDRLNQALDESDAAATDELFDSKLEDLPDLFPEGEEETPFDDNMLDAIRDGVMRDLAKRFPHVFNPDAMHRFYTEGAGSPAYRQMVERSLERVKQSLGTAPED